MKTYAEAEEYLAGGRNPNYRRLPGRATDMCRRGDGGIAVLYHSTDVVTYYPDKIVLNSGGWRTQTTKDRGNQYSPAHIFQENGLWYVRDGERVTLFYDGMEVDNAGVPLAPATCGQRYRLETAKRQVDKLVSRYIRGFVSYLRAVGYLAYDESERRLPSTAAPALLRMLEERSFYRLLLLEAIQERGYSNPAFIVELINSDLRRGDSNLYLVKDTLRAYFRKWKLALAELIVEREGV